MYDRVIFVLAELVPDVRMRYPTRNKIKVNKAGLRDNYYWTKKIRTKQKQAYAEI